MILRLSLDLPENISYIRTTRLLSRTLLEDIKVSKPIIDDVEVIVSELCTNVVRHAQSKETHFLMTMEYYEPKVVIIVKDAGRGFAQEDVLPTGTERSDGEGGERFGGFGLVLLKGMSDKIDFTETNPHGTTVRVEKNLRYDTQEDANDAKKRDTEVGGEVAASKD